MRKVRILLTCLFLTFISMHITYADEATDLIQNYIITVDVNEDGTLNMQYHIDWEVLDDEQLGPLEWVQIGVPNAYNYDVEAQSDNISDIYSDDEYVYVYFDQEYYEGEVVSFDYSFTQDYMYEVDDDYTNYYFTPGWFDGIEVENLTINWNAQSVESADGASLNGDYFTWTTSLAAGETYDISVSYLPDAFNFDSDKNYSDVSNDYYYYDYDDYYDDDYYDDGDDFFSFILVIVFAVIFVASWVGEMIESAAYDEDANFTPGEPTIKRVVYYYYDVCPSCGTPAGDGDKVCQVCGRDLLKERVAVEDSDSTYVAYRTSGFHPYVGHPHVFVNVSVTPPPRPPRSGGGHNHHSGGGHGGGHAGGGHSCACACASCACACACACAGGGRAGCTNKDFYNTNLKLEQLAKKQAKK